MDHEIEPAPFFLDLGQGVVDGGKVRHVAIDDDFRPDRFCQRDGTAGESLALIGEGKRRSLA
jgi:hypothetical protein